MYFSFLSFGGGEIILVFLAVLILFGADKIPDFARMLGKGMNEFRKATDDLKREFREETKEFQDDLKESQSEINEHVREIKDTVRNNMEGYDAYEGNTSPKEKLKAEEDPATDKNKENNAE